MDKNANLSERKILRELHRIGREMVQIKRNQLNFKTFYFLGTFS